MSWFNFMQTHYAQAGGGNCSLCGSPNTTKTNCPLNPMAKNPNPEKHPLAIKKLKKVKEISKTVQPKLMRSIPIRAKTLQHPVQVVESTLEAIFMKPSKGNPSASKPNIGDINQLQSWLNLDGQIPSYTSGDPYVYSNDKYQFITLEDYLGVQSKLFEDILNKYQGKSEHWFGEKPEIDMESDPIFVQKVRIEDPNSRVFLIGDLHSSLTSLINILLDIRDKY